MEKKSVVIILISLIFLGIFFAGCQSAEKKPEEKPEEVVDTGMLAVDSYPANAHVYVNGEFKGDTPLNLYNLPIGAYDIVVKKEGYANFEKTANVKVGRTEEIYAELNALSVKGAEEKKPVEKPVEVVAENLTAKTPNLKKINLSSFAMYYDFEREEFTEIRTDKSDLFSRRYDTYVHFTALEPTKICIINKPITDVTKEDCIFGDTEIAPLFSGQTLCANTGEGAVVAIGGIWKESPTELEWVKFS